VRSIQFALIIRNRGAVARVCALVFVFLMGSSVQHPAWAQQSAPSAASEGSTAATPSTPGAPEQAPADNAPAANQANGAANRPNVSLPAGFDQQKRVPLYETIQEDWSSLSIGASRLEPEPPLVAQTDEGDGFTRMLVQMQWRPGDPLDVYVILPKGVKKPPAVLYLYGYKDDTDRFKDNRWCKRATAGGFAAVGFVSALSGHRFHDRPMRQWFVSELQESLGSTVHDVKFILDYLAQRGDIDMNRIGMFGQSSGGTIALLAAAADPRIKAVDVLDPWGDWPVWLAQSWVVNQDPDHASFTDADFLKRVAPLDPMKWLPMLKTRHIRIQQIMDNSATPDDAKDAIKKAAPKRTEVVRYDHLSQFADVAAGGQLFSWVKVQLKATPTPAAKKRTAVAQQVVPGMDKTGSAGTVR
jgi:pimeloyl-ACP methyl ester carboxylesterase